ncbi:MAG TPA: hypothetical protein VKA38_03345, partial [Draconibacterium sp.]|nr:hypothetical protein [Draconibacterium sp.]
SEIRSASGINLSASQRRNQKSGLPDVNSSFLDAVELKAADWDETPNVNAPDFPQDGTWKVKTENLQKLP